MNTRRGLCGTILALAAAAALAGPSRAAGLPEGELIAALQKGGLVVVMRHASSPATLPTAVEADPGNTTLERQLDAAGRQAATGLGAAWRALRIPVGDVWSSPTFRARETVRLAGWPTPKLAPELGDSGRSMQAAGSDQGAWLRAKTAEPPPAGTNRAIVTHYPNLSAAFGSQAEGMADGEAMIFRPAAGGATLLGRLPIDGWPNHVQR